MIDGMLVINLDPASIGFSPAMEGHAENNAQISHWRSCSVEDIRHLLLELDAITPDQVWPPRECVLRLSIRLPKSVIKRLDLASIHALKSLSAIREAPLRS